MGTLNYVGVDLTKEHENDAFDLRSQQYRVIAPGDRAMVRTGTKVQIPEGHTGLLCSRSGMALKEGVFVLNAPGIIDPGYTGEVGVILQNLGDQPYRVNKGDRVAQLLVVKQTHLTAQKVDGIVEGSRGDNGFGSTGKD